MHELFPNDTFCIEYYKISKTEMFEFTSKFDNYILFLL